MQKYENLVDLRKMLKNAPTLTIVAVHTAENEPLKVSLVHFIISIKGRIEILQKLPQFLERLVLGCMDSYDSESKRIFSIFRDLQDFCTFAPLRP